MVLFAHDRERRRNDPVHQLARSIKDCAISSEFNRRGVTLELSRLRSKRRM
jgi:hypothetical protein